MSSAFRIVLGTWLVALFFVLNIYTGTLTSVLTTPKYKFLVESLEDVIANEEIKPLILKGSPAYVDLTVRLYIICPCAIQPFNVHFFIDFKFQNSRRI